MFPKKIITRTVLLVSLISFFTDIASEMLYPVMPVYLKSIGFSIVLIGILEGIAEATAGISKGYFGQLSDKTGKRMLFVRLGYGLSAMAKPLTGLFTWPLWVFFGRTLDRFGKGIRSSARDALLSSETTPENKGRVFGFHRMFDTAGAALGPVIALIFLWKYPEQYRWLFLIAVLPGIFSIAISFMIKEKMMVANTKEKKPGFFSYFKYWKKAPKNYRLLISGLLIFTLLNSSDAFLLLMLKHRGFDDATMIGFYILYNIAYAIFSYPMGIIADKTSMKKVMIFGLLMFSIVYVFMGFAFSFIHFIILFLIYSLYAASNEGISKAWISNLAKKEETATAIGLFNSLSSIFAMLSSTIAGLIWFAGSPTLMFLISGLGVFALIFYFGFVISEKKELNL